MVLKNKQEPKPNKKQKQNQKTPLKIIPVLFIPIFVIIIMDYLMLICCELFPSDIPGI